VGIAALAVVVALSGAAAVAVDDAGPTPKAEVAAVTTTTAPTTTTTAPPTTAPPAPTTTVPPPPPVPGALAPIVAGEDPVAALEPVALADQILQSELAIRDPAARPEVFDAAARLQQVAYRRLGENPAWEPEVLARTPVELHEAIWRQATARREFRAMHTRLGVNLPAWRIVDPLPADQLLATYQEAEGRFGVPWHVLAAVNLVETGMGRIVGLSVAGAQGPMQFMPATWSAYGMGGDVWNTRDAIMGAANYLAANGGNRGTEDGLRNALFHYNRSDHYVQGVLHYAELMRLEPRTYLALHRWPIAYLTAYGDIILPTGYEQPEPVPALDWLAANG
jgi:membrane-bound lytic murein transglycosylase B